MMKHKYKVLMVNTSAADPNVRMDMEIEMLASAGYDVSVLGWDRNGSYLKTVELEHCRSYKIKLRAPTKGGRKIVLFWPFWWCAEFIWLMRRKWDIVHVADLDAFIPALLAAKLKRKPVIYDIYDVYADSVPLPGLARHIVLHIEKFFAKTANIVILTSDGHRQRLGLKSGSKVNFIYNVCKYMPGKIKPRDTDKFRIFYAGTLFKSAMLNLDKVIMAIGDMEDVEFVIAGYGDDYQDEMKALVKDNNFNNVEFLGKLSREDVLKETLNSDLLFVLYDPELPVNAISLPHKLFDALTYGKPILVPEGTTLADFVSKYNCGIPVNCRSSSDIGEAITKLKNDPDFYNRFVEGGRKAHQEEFNWNSTGKQMLSLYENILKSKQSTH